MDRKSLVTKELVDGTFIVRMNSIVINEQFLDDLNKIIGDINSSSANLKSVVFISDLDNIFLAGADLSLMQSSLGDNKALGELIDRGHNTFNRIQEIDVPTIAAINGACLGGGFELALACDYRIASTDKSTKIGLPEVNLGILPAWGGTTRLPRLVGLITSLKVILGGAQNPAKYAKKIGLVDDITFKENLEERALKLSTNKIKRKKPFLRNPINSVVFHKALSNVMKKTAGNYPAPLKIIAVLKQSCKVSLKESLKLEREAFIELANTRECSNLIRIFFMQERFKKLKFKNMRPSDPIKNVCVTGAGTMGAGIAQWLSSRGMNVILKDIDKQAIANGLKTIGDIFVQGVRGHKLDRPSARDGLSRITSTTQDVSLANQDLVIEAIVENMAVKKKVLKSIEDKAGPNTIIASNTSALSIDEMAECLDRPENFVGIHFFNPVHKMKLVEIVVGSKTSDETIAYAVQFVQKISKFPIVVKDSPGFVVNRILMPYLIEAARQYEKGIQPEVVDKELIKWGMPMGPFRLMDEIGLDVCLHVAKDLSNRLGFDIPNILTVMIDKGHLGRKTGKGFYEYKKGRSVKRKLQSSSVKHKTDVTVAITTRMIVEAGKVLKEQIVAEGDDIDFAMIMGTGFAPFKGGPIKYRETL